MNAVTAIFNEFEAAGFTLVRWKKHYIWACPCGHTQVTSSGSHNEGRGDDNCKARIRRTIKICKQQLEERA